MRRSLALLAISGLLPLVALSGFIGTKTLVDQRREIEGRAHAHAQFAATLIADRLADDERAVASVAGLPFGSDPTALLTFRNFASRVLLNQPTWRTISIADAGGKRLLDVPQPIGGRIGGRVVDLPSLLRCIASGRPAVGDVVRGPRGTYAFAIRAPQEGQQPSSRVISAVIPASTLHELLLFQPLPAGWRAGVVDGAGHFVALSSAASNVGLLVSREARVARASGVQGLYHFRRRDGVAAAAVFVPVAGTDWTVHVSMPETYFSGPARGAVLLLVGVTLLCLLLFAILARLLLVELRDHRARQDAALQGQRMEALGRLTGGVAHDFNNLLTPIIGGLDLVRTRLTEDPRSLRYVEAALASAERARTLVGRLLAFSRRQTLAPRDVDVDRLIRGLSDLIDRSLTPAIDVDIRISQGLPAVRVDPAQLELAILNLIINARDAMPTGGRLMISSRVANDDERSELSDGDYVAVVIADTGAGMDAATLSQATDPFFTTKGAGEGTGLGLSMVHGFAAQSGGMLRLRSSPGVGTEAAIILPRGEAIVEESPKGQPAAFAPKSILLVDDDDVVRRSTADMLHEGGHRVTEAQGVEEAFALLNSGAEFDAVVTDYLMPGRSGADLIRALREEKPTLPVLLVTGYISRTGDVPPDVPTLTKPFRYDELLTALDQAVPA